MLIFLLLLLLTLNAQSSQESSQVESSESQVLCLRRKERRDLYKRVRMAKRRRSMASSIDWSVPVVFGGSTTEEAETTQ